MKMSGAFPSKFLKATDLDGEQLFVITEVKMEVVGQEQDELPVVYFGNVDKGLVLNKTNGATIAAGHGDETDRWTGQPIVLFATTTDFKGQRVDCIRCRMATDEEIAAKDVPAVPF